MKAMKNMLILLSITLILGACKSGKVQEEPLRSQLVANTAGKGPELYLDFKMGKSHNHPSFVIWAETMEGKFIQTLFITRAVGTGIYEHGDPSSGHWEPGEIRRPASLPYWSHKRGIREADGLWVPSAENPVADAFTGATPAGNFGLWTRFDEPINGKIRILFEINQTWDWNEYWTNNKYPDDEEYKTSCQPALVYMCEVDTDQPKPEYSLRVIGHSHYSGKDGKLYTDISSMTTALQIINSLTIKFL